MNLCPINTIQSVSLTNILLKSRAQFIQKKVLKSLNFTNNMYTRKKTKREMITKDFCANRLFMILRIKMNRSSLYLEEILMNIGNLNKKKVIFLNLVDLTTCCTESMENWQLLVCLIIHKMSYQVFISSMILNGNFCLRGFSQLSKR